MKESLTREQAAKLVLLSQRLPPIRYSGSAMAAIEHLGYIQIDAISVIQRAHHHTLWNRNPRYKSSQLDQLVEGGEVFEYWSHAAAYLPMSDYRYSLPRKHALRSGALDHWFDRDDAMMDRVLERIAHEGPLRASDFEHVGKKVGDWKAKPAKQALEYLFMQGELMVRRREKFQKVYDLTDRVIPEDTNTTMPNPEEHARFLIARYLQANGLGQAGEISYLLKGMKPLISRMLAEMVSSGEVQNLEVAGESYCVLPESLELLGKPLARSKLKILSPFDNLLIQRKRTKALFGFDYLIECYLPKAKRQYGYFSLPVLWSGRLVARMDCRVERSESLLHIDHLALEPSVLKRSSNLDVFISALQKELKAFLRFNGCERVRLHRGTPSSILPEIQRALNDMEK